jgi:preprotein translocase subunit SecE
MKSESVAKHFTQWPVRLKSYIDELQTEMRRVTWPSWKQVRSTTVVVIATVFAFAGYFAVVDFVLGRAIGRVFDTFIR